MGNDLKTTAQAAMIDPNCRICFGLGWVCENHPLSAWDRLGCQCGAGMPCECQRADGLEQPDTSQIIEDEDDVR